MDLLLNKDEFEKWYKDDPYYDEDIELNYPTEYPCLAEIEECYTSCGFNYHFKFIYLSDFIRKE